MNTGIIIIIVIVVLIALLGCIFAGMYNGLVKKRIRCEESFSTMDVYMKKRYDLIPNIVETVKGYANHEKETLENVIKARNMAAASSGAEEQIANDNILSGTLKSLFAVAEAYPDLKANANFMELQSRLSAIEEDIANSRKYYNATVREFNTDIEIFPKNIVASMFKFEKKPMYEIQNEAGREPVKVQF